MTTPRVKQLLSESAGSLSFFTANSRVGDTVTGRIVATAIRQATEYRTKKPLFWDDGNPRQQIVVTVATTLRDPAVTDDDGTRSIYIKWWGGQRTALTQAIRDSGDDDIRVGGTFTARFDREDAPEDRGMSPTKVYVYSYTPPSATGALFDNVHQAAAQPTDPWTAAQQAAADQAAAAAARAAAAAAAAVQQAPAAAAPAVAAPPAAAGDPATVLAQAKVLIQMGLTDAQIGGTLGVDAAAVAAIRNIPA